MMSRKEELKFEELRGPAMDKFVKANNHTNAEGMIKIWPSGCVMPKIYRENAERIRNFEVRPGDVWLVTFPKCGTTWTQELVWLLLNNLDYEKAKSVPLLERSPFIELQCRLLPGDSITNEVGDTVKQAEECRPPRLIKSHLPLELLPHQLWTVRPKVIYVARNAKATAVSYYHHYRMFEGYTGTLEDFVEAFVEGIVEWGPFWRHILDFWKIRDEPNVLFHTFENMKKDLPGSVQKIANFLNCKYNSTQLEKLCNYVSFDSMKKNSNLLSTTIISSFKSKALQGVSHQFFREGETNSWQKDLSPEMIEKIDKWTQEQLKGTRYVE